MESKAGKKSNKRSNKINPNYLYKSHIIPLKKKKEKRSVKRIKSTH